MEKQPGETFYYYRFRRLSQLGHDQTPLFKSLEQADHFCAVMYRNDPGPFNFDLQTVTAFDVAAAAHQVAKRWGNASFYRGDRCYWYRSDIWRVVSCSEFAAAPLLIPLCSLT